MIDKTICPVCGEKTKPSGRFTKSQFSCYIEGSHEVMFFLEKHNIPNHYTIDLFGPKTMGIDFSMEVTYLGNNKTRMYFHKWNNFKAVTIKLLPQQKFWTEDQWLNYIRNYRLM